MVRQVNYTLVGAFVILLSLALVTIFAWLFMKAGRESYQTYLVYIKSDVTGLTEDSPVRYNGVKVGYVKSIQLDKNNLQRVKVVLRITEDTPINTSTVATAMPQGITGILYISLQSNKPHAPKLKAKPGQRFPVIPSEPSVFSQIGKVVPEVAKKMEQLMDDLDEIFNKTNRKKLNNIITNIEKTSQSMARNTNRYDSITKNMDQTFKRVNKASEKLPQLTKDAKVTLAQIKQSAKSAEHMMQSGQETMGQISDQMMPQTQQLITRLNNIANHLNSLARELNKNPSVLVRGKEPQPLGPGESGTN